MSGQHVVYGFTRPLARWMLPQHRMTVLHYEGETPPVDLLELEVETIAVGRNWKPWYKRIAWETTQLSKIVRKHDVDKMLNVSGALAPRCPVSQVVLCQNPWCYVRAAHRGSADRMKAALQRIGYRKAFRDAAMMIYISNHLRELYQRGNQGVSEAESRIAYVGLDDDTFATAQRLQNETRQTNTILSVSAMASWKGAHTIIDAVRLLKDRGIDAKLKLAGPWPDAKYEARIRDQILTQAVSDRVEILGRVSDDDLHRLYATSGVFCLMSSCESYGIPAAEAMAFGTPVVSTTCCAIAEICHGAGQFGPVNDPQWTANALQTALIDDKKWQTWSTQARENASRLTWDNCAMPLRDIEKLCTT